MISNILFDLNHPTLRKNRPNFWFYGAATFTSGYLMFALLFEGTKGLSTGGFIFAVIAASWLIIGVVTRQAKFPLILLFPIAFFLMIVLSGFQLIQYPTEYLLRMVTIWVGSIAVGGFLANGLSANLIIFWLAVIVAANLAAITLGYDNSVINKQDFSAGDLDRVEIIRASGLASHQNVLVGIAFLLPFAIFFLRSTIPAVMFFVLCAVCIAITVFTGSRTGILFTAIFMLLGSIFLMPKNPLRFLVILGGAIAVFIATLFLNDSNAVSKIEQSALGEVIVVQRVISKLDNEDGSSEIRKIMQDSVGPLYSQKPVLGHGPGQFKEISGFDAYAHNNYVEIAVNFGLIGLILYYVMYGASALGILLTPGKNLYLIAPLLFLILADNWFVTYVNRPLALCLCILLVLTFPTFKKKSRRQRKSRQDMW